ncbi:UDP-N-acetyl-D-mannosamine dehydrogenase, partial [Vibrio parahaemolyticus]
SLAQVELQSFELAKANADIHVMLVDHKEFKTESLSSPYLVDTKGIW